MDSLKEPLHILITGTAAGFELILVLIFPSCCPNSPFWPHSTCPSHCSSHRPSHCPSHCPSGPLCCPSFCISCCSHFPSLSYCPINLSFLLSFSHIFLLIIPTSHAAQDESHRASIRLQKCIDETKKILVLPENPDDDEVKKQQQKFIGKEKGKRNSFAGHQNRRETPTTHPGGGPVKDLMNGMGPSPLMGGGGGGFGGPGGFGGGGPPGGFGRMSSPMGGGGGGPPGRGFGAGSSGGYAGGPEEGMFGGEGPPGPFPDA